jgi:hypothetical protein
VRGGCEEEVAVEGCEVDIIEGAYADLDAIMAIFVGHRGRSDWEYLEDDLMELLMDY